jgi:ABC-2 type transport system permease protein
MKKYFLVWWRNAVLYLQSILVTRWASGLFVLGKLLRFVVFGWFLVHVGSQVQQLSGYTLQDLILFYLIFNFFDMLGQIVFRGIYWFRADVVSGAFDYYLLKPMNVLFLALTRRTDLLDVPLFLVVVALLVVYLWGYSSSALLLGVLFGIVSFLVLTSIHIIVAGLGIISQEVDNAMMIYRYTSGMGRVPIGIYTNIIQWLLMVVMPIGIIFTIPAQALVGEVSWLLAIGVLCVASGFLFGSLWLWRYALQHYTSASS